MANETWKRSIKIIRCSKCYSKISKDERYIEREKDGEIKNICATCLEYEGYVL